MYWYRLQIKWDYKKKFKADDMVIRVNTESYGTAEWLQVGEENFKQFVC
jgi:hypothetical protein